MAKAFKYVILGAGIAAVSSIYSVEVSAAQAVKAIKAAEKGETVKEYVYLPYYFSNPFRLPWHFFGYNEGEAVLFGDSSPESSEPKFGSYWIKDERIVGAFLVGGTYEENQAIAEVARFQVRVKPVDRLAEEGLSYAVAFLNIEN